MAVILFLCQTGFKNGYVVSFSPKWKRGIDSEPLEKLSWLLKRNIRKGCIIWFGSLFCFSPTFKHFAWYLEPLQIAHSHENGGHTQGKRDSEQKVGKKLYCGWPAELTYPDNRSLIWSLIWNSKFSFLWRLFFFFAEPSLIFGWKNPNRKSLTHRWGIIIYSMKNPSITT